MEFEQIYNTYFNDVYLYIRRLSGDEYIAEEITSETFFKAMNAIEHFRGNCDLRVWLCQIAKNSYYSFLKKQKREDADNLEINYMIDPHSFIEEKIITREQTIQIQNLLHRISEPYKEVFMWRVYADLSFKQIGQIFNKSDNWACVTYHRAKQQLIKRMEEQENEK